MTNLAESFQGRDLGHLHIIAELWGIEIEEQDTRGVLNQLVSMLSNTSRVENMVLNLTSAEKEALIDLIRHAGRLPWAQFSRVYGEVREMGVARRDREQPYKQPVSVAEALWYLGMIARAFFDTPTGPEEFAYIPDDLLAQIPITDNERFPRNGKAGSICGICPGLPGK